MAINRRTLLSSVLLLNSVNPGFPQNPEDSIREYQKGDLDMEYEVLRAERRKLDNIVAADSRAIFEPKIPDFGRIIVDAAKDCVGMSRADSKDDITLMLALFGLPFSYPDGQNVPFCAAGLSFAAALGYCKSLNKNINAFNTISTLRQVLGDLDHWYFYPTPSVWSMYEVARGKRLWTDAHSPIWEPKPGWIVVYDFGKGADHCGIVEKFEAGILHTIEFNTTVVRGSEINGGVVARKMRKYDQKVKGFIKI